MSRALLNNEAVANFIKDNFVPASGAVEHLQPSRYGTAESEASKWFAPVAKRALKEFAPTGFFKQFGSYQGMYVVGPDGTPFEFKIGLAYDSGEFIEILQSALLKSRAAQSVRTHAPKTVSPPSKEAPPGAKAATSVIQVNSRICPLPGNATLAERSIGRDVMWIFPDEVNQILCATIAPGVNMKMPPTLVARMVRFHLLNHVGNIMKPFSENDVTRADFKMTPIESKGSIRTIGFQGSYKSQAPISRDNDAPYSMEGTIEGRVSIDKIRRNIVQFRAFGEGVSQGGNDSLSKARRYPVVFAMSEATQPSSRSMKPFWSAIPTWEQVYERPKILTH
ncbi:MAG: hypothetical protein K2W95_33455 [Candidatus Obscuribacterales bacterium]|nr:hypothetical protein [Candidatus Obscuribacterales bacterium]